MRLGSSFPLVAYPVRVLGSAHPERPVAVLCAMAESVGAGDMTRGHAVGLPAAVPDVVLD